jgi:hypothetical protein
MLIVKDVIAIGELDVFISMWLPVVLFAVLPFAWSILRLTERLRRGRGCANCSYNLTGNTSGLCPECGQPIDQGSPPV